MANGESKSAFLHHGQGDNPLPGGCLVLLWYILPQAFPFYGLAVSGLLLFPAWL